MVLRDQVLNISPWAKCWRMADRHHLIEVQILLMIFWQPHLCRWQKCMIACHYGNLGGSSDLEVVWDERVKVIFLPARFKFFKQSQTAIKNGFFLAWICVLLHFKTTLGSLSNYVIQRFNILCTFHRRYPSLYSVVHHVSTQTTPGGINLTNTSFCPEPKITR